LNGIVYVLRMTRYSKSDARAYINSESRAIQFEDLGGVLTHSHATQSVKPVHGVANNGSLSMDRATEVNPVPVEGGSESVGADANASQDVAGQAAEKSEMDVSQIPQIMYSKTHNGRV
jgi:hypothetical protein